MTGMFRACLIGAGLALMSPLAVAESAVDGMDKARQGDFGGAYDILSPMAKQGDALAQFNLALLYHSGMGVSRDEAEAVRLYISSAQKGHPMAQEYLAVAYAEGWFGLAKDREQAEFWAEKAAAQ